MRFSKATAIEAVVFDTRASGYSEGAIGAAVRVMVLDEDLGRSAAGCSQNTNL